MRSNPESRCRPRTRSTRRPEAVSPSPTGVRVEPVGSVFGSSDMNVAVTSPDQADTAPSNTVGPVRVNSSQAPYIPVWTDTSGRLRFRTDATAGSFFINTWGWVDARGRFD